MVYVFRWKCCVSGLYYISDLGLIVWWQRVVHVSWMAKFLLLASECFQACEIIAFGIIACELFAPKEPMCMYLYKRKMKWYVQPSEEGTRRKQRVFGHLCFFVSSRVSKQGWWKSKLRWFISKLEARKGKHPHPYRYVFSSYTYVYR